MYVLCLTYGKYSLIFTYLYNHHYCTVMQVTEGRGRVSTIKGRQSLPCLHIPWSRAGKTGWTWPPCCPRPSLLDCHSSAEAAPPICWTFPTRTGGYHGLNPAAVSQLNLLPDFQWIPGHRFSHPCPSDVASDWFSLLNTYLGLCPQQGSHGPLPRGWGKRLRHAKMTAELSPLWGPTVRRMMALCLMEQLPLWLPHPMSTCHAPVDHQLLCRKVLQSCDDLICLPYRPQNMILLRSLWVLQIYWQMTFYTQDKLLIIKETCFSVPGPYFTTDGSQPSGLAT